MDRTSTVKIAVQACLAWSRQALENAMTVGAQQDDYPGEVELNWLLKSLAGIDLPMLRRADPSQVVSLPCDLAELSELWRRHYQDHVPLQYLVGRSPWRRFELQVSSAVLVPRPETELIVEIAQNISQERGLNHGHWSDLGTGSGAIALGLAELIPNITIHAVDCSAEALAVAAKNISQVQGGVWGDRILLHQGYWFEPLAAYQGNLQAMISNPPYIPTNMLANLQPEVRFHEPSLALDGGSDGLDCLRDLVTTGATFLRPGGLWLVELMVGQAEPVKGLLEANGNYDAIAGHYDLAGIERFVSALRRNTSPDSPRSPALLTNG